MKFIRITYDWVLSWADKPSGPTALGLISAAEASFFPVPPDILLIPLALGNRLKALKFALICSICSILGAVIGYGIGKWAWWVDGESYTSFAQFFFNHIPGFTHDGFQRVQDLYRDWDFWIVFTAGFTPIPFKLFTISAGVASISFPMFFLASLISRTARFFLVAGLIKMYGEPIQKFIDDYFNLLATAFTILLIGGFALINFLI